MKALAFGTGVLLRGLVADAAERAAIRLTMVSSTAAGDARAQQLAAAGQFTLRARGLGDDGRPIDEARAVRSIARAISASAQWPDVLATATDPGLSLVLSNVTESALHTVDDEIDGDAAAAGRAPVSFPARLTAWLWARERADIADTVTVLPCELVGENGPVVQALVSAVATRWNAGPVLDAIAAGRIVFASTLVDRICTPDPDDPLAAIVEPYAFWAIQGSKTGPLQALADAWPEAIAIAGDISGYALRKVRILNGLHTAMASIAPRFHVTTVRDALEHPELGPWLGGLLTDEILPAICPPLARADADAYARATLRRMNNPFLEHQLSAIAVGAPAKWENRLLPTMAAYESRFGTPPPKLTACREAFITAR
jgi:tagaturonate reductase